MDFTFITNPLNMIGLKIYFYFTAILSIILATAIVFFVTRKFTIASGIITLLIAGLLYLLISATRGAGMENSLPSVGYPVPPHFLQGVSLQNYYPNKVGYGI